MSQRELTAARTVDAELWHTTPFRWISTRERSALRRQLDLAVIESGQQLYVAGTTPHEVTFVLAGQLASSPPSVVFGAGAALGVSAAMHPCPPLETDIVALERTVLAVFEQRRFVASLETCPTFAAALLREIAAADPTPWWR